MSDPKYVNLGRVRGKSSYEHALAGGYQGSETEFNEKLNDVLNTEVDTAPAAGSENLITSGAVHQAINAIPTPDVSGQIGTHNTNAEAHADIRQAIEDIEDNYLSTDGGTMKGILYTEASTPLLIGKNGKVGMRAATTDKANVGQINISNAWYGNGNQWGSQISAYNGATDKYNELRVSHDGVEYNSEDGVAHKVLHDGNIGDYADPKGTAKKEIADLINGAPTTLDTLGEIATAMESNADVVEALEQAIGSKADASAVPTKTSQLTNDSGFITGYTETDPTVPAWAKAASKPSYTASEVGAVPTSRTVNGKALSSNISLSAADVGASADFSIELYNGTSGNPKPVRFASFNYSTCDSENGIAAKISMVSGHGNGSSYAFLQDAIIKVGHTGSVSVDNFKYYGTTTGTYDEAVRQYGDIFWLVDETNKIVDFYCLMGQYARINMTPWKRLTYSSGGSVTQYTSCTVYSSGTKTWANNSDIALKSDIPTLTTETWVLTIENEDGSTETVRKAVVLGEPNLIAFTIDGTTYQAEECMTWVDWAESEYNTGVITVHGNASTASGYNVQAYGSILRSGGIAVDAQEAIISGHAYST